MPEITEYSPGSFCWVDGGTTDLEKAKAFYAALFGWDYAAVDESGYTMCLRGGRPVAGLYSYDRNMLDMGAPPCWTSYVAVADADAAMASAVAAGAQPMGPVFDVPGHGRAGAFSDPTGALCGIWQARGHQGSGRFDEPGTMVWHELQTRDPGAAGAFYSSVFGWAQETTPMPGAPYYLFKDGEHQRGGMMAHHPGNGRSPVAMGGLLPGGRCRRHRGEGGHCRRIGRGPGRGRPRGGPLRRPAQRRRGLLLDPPAGADGLAARAGRSARSASRRTPRSRGGGSPCSWGPARSSPTSRPRSCPWSVRSWSRSAR